MNIEAKRKYMLLCIVILLIAAIAAGTSDFWKDSGVESAKQGYVAVIRIDGPIYGGPDTDSILSGSSGVTSEQIMKEFQTARKDPPGQGHPGAHQQPRRFYGSYPGNCRGNG